MRRESLVVTLLSALFLLSIFIGLWGQLSNHHSKKTAGQASQFLKKGGIGILSISGPISFSSGNGMMPSTGPGTSSLLQELSELEKDPKVKALIIRINSPGGTVGASQELFTALLRFKEKKKVPVVASIGDIGASGAYYAALAADTIFANPGSLVGSIGVIMGNIDVSKLAEKHGVGFKIFKSGPYKDLLSMWRPSSENEKQLLQALIDSVYTQFLNALIDQRPLNKKQAEKMAQGQIFTGEQAQSNQLVDELGGLHEAIAFTGKLANLGDEPVLIKKSKRSFYDVLKQWQGSIDTLLPTHFFNQPVFHY